MRSSKKDNSSVRPSTTRTSVQGLLHDTSEAAQSREQFSELEKKMALGMVELIDQNMAHFSSNSK